MHLAGVVKVCRRTVLKGIRPACEVAFKRAAIGHWATVLGMRQGNGGFLPAWMLALRRSASRGERSRPDTAGSRPRGLPGIRACELPRNC